MDLKLKLCDPPSGHNLTNFIIPAKLLTVEDEKAKVIFFGRSKLETVPIENCSIYSIEVPSSPMNLQKMKDLKAAQEVILLMILELIFS